MSSYEMIDAVVEDTRKLVSVVVVDDIIKHPNADALELAIVGGWQCCVQIGEFKKGDLAVYCEIDSLLPVSNPIFTFLEARSSDLKQVGEVVYSRIKTIRLRKELSQGLLVPFPDEWCCRFRAGDNLTQELGVLKYDAPAPVPEGYVAKKTLLDKICNWIAGGPGRSNLLPWPQFLKKSDEERVQNLAGAYAAAVAKDEEFEATYKLDGGSMTAWMHKDFGHYNHGVCLRNRGISLIDDIWSPTEQLRRWVANLFLFNRRILKIRRFIFPRWSKGFRADDDQYVKVYNELQIGKKLETMHQDNGLELAIQGELCGPGIQSNFENLDRRRFFVYKVYVLGFNEDYTGDEYDIGLLGPEAARTLVEVMGLTMVPIFSKRMKLPATLKECLDLADGEAAFKKGGFREGLVFKSLSSKLSFKVISNKYLLKTDN